MPFYMTGTSSNNLLIWTNCYKLLASAEELMLNRGSQESLSLNECADTCLVSFINVCLWLNEKDRHLAFISVECGMHSPCKMLILCKHSTPEQFLSVTFQLVTPLAVSEQTAMPSKNSLTIRRPGFYYDCLMLSCSRNRSPWNDFTLL